MKPRRTSYYSLFIVSIWTGTAELNRDVAEVIFSGGKDSLDVVD